MSISAKAARLIIIFIAFYLWTVPSMIHAAGGEEATVRNYTLNMHVDAAVSSAVVKSLKRGDAVIVDYEVEGADGSKWCFILEEGSYDMGYVPCDSLGRKTAGKLSGRSPDKSDSKPTDTPGTEHNSSVRVVLYMTDW